MLTNMFVCQFASPQRVQVHLPGVALLHDLLRWVVGIFSNMSLFVKLFNGLSPTGVSLANLKVWRRAALSVLLVSNLAAALYTGLVHQRGTLDVMTHLHTLCDASRPQTTDVLFLMPCHSTPFYRCCKFSCLVFGIFTSSRLTRPFFCSHVHCPMKMRFLECPPDLGQDGYVEEAARFYSDPLIWLRTSFPYKSSLPSHLVLFNVLEKVRYLQMRTFPMWHLVPDSRRLSVFPQEISVFLQANNFSRTAEIFHTHFPEGRVGGSIFIYERHWQTLEQRQSSYENVVFLLLNKHFKLILKHVFYFLLCLYWMFSIFCKWLVCKTFFQLFLSTM